jgi:hypothetical protein
LDILKVERDSCSGTYLTSDDGNEVSDIKVENDTDVREDDPMPAVFSAVKAEYEVSYMCVTSHNWPELSFCLIFIRLSTLNKSTDVNTMILNQCFIN